MVRQCCRSGKQFPESRKLELPWDPAIPSLDLHVQENSSYVHTKTCVAALSCSKKADPTQTSIS